LAQHNIPQSYSWAFGSRGGVSFTSGAPVAFASNISTNEGSASVADASGNMLFYTDGRRVWDATHAVMPSGGSLVAFATSSTSQGSLIMPVLGNASQYYLFSLEDYSGTVGRLYYCIVDMSLRSGLGDVVAGTIGTLFATGIGERMCATQGDACDLWLITHKKGNRDFSVYNLTASGFGSVVTSTVGSFTATASHNIGQLRVSPDRTKIGSTCYGGGSYTANTVGCEVFDFNSSTGVVSNGITLDSTDCPYGVEFSPDNSKLYICPTGFASGTGAKLTQFDLSAGSAAAIRASRTVINSVSGTCFPSLKLGPDDKIYLGSMSSAASNFLDCIASPNTAGTGCGFTTRAVTLSSGATSYYGLPNTYMVPGFGDTSYARHDTVVCIPTGRSITLTDTATALSYYWNDGVTTASHTFTTFGTWWVTAQSGCHLSIDTFVISRQPSDTTWRIHDTSNCALTFPITLSVPTGYPTYHWYDGAGGTTHTVAGPGTYWVWADDSCGNVLADTFHVTAIPPDTTIGYSRDSAVCIGVGSLVLNASPGYTSYRWNTGSATSSATVSASGTYWVYKTINCSIVVDTFHVTFIPYPVLNLGPDVAFCIGDSIVLQSFQPAGTSYIWSTGSTNDSIHVLATGTYWLQLYNGCYKRDTINITVSPYPVVDLGPDSFNCEGQAVVLQSSVSYTGALYYWSNSNTTPTTTVTTSGTYWLRVNVAGCSSFDTVNVTIIYDTFTLINHDTAICKGKYVQAVLYANPGATFQWLPTAGISYSTVANPIITPDTSARYTAYIYMTGCPVKSVSFAIDVQPNPQVFIGGNRFICEFDTLHLAGIVRPEWYTGYTYSWTPATFLDGTTTKTAVYTAGTTTDYMLTVTTSAGCVGKDSAKVIVNPGNFGVISPDAYLCPHDSIQLSATGGTSYHWYPTMYVNDSTSASPWIKAITTTNYSVVATSSLGCKDTLHVTVNVYPAAMISIEDSIRIYPGETVELHTITNCTSIYWNPPVGLSNPYISNPVADPGADTRYFVYGTTVNGCKAVDSVNLLVSKESEINVPNAFTPGTGSNNKFIVLKEGIAVLNHFRVYNRWGVLLFETKDITEGWDGTYKGDPQPMSVYIYDVQAVTSTGKIISRHGNVTLLR
jgi:gliding motility-associated-like protein